MRRVQRIAQVIGLKPEVIDEYERIHAAVWPAVWPAAPMAAFLLATRPLVGASLPAIAGELAAAGPLYLAVFFILGISAAERRFYLAGLEAVTSRWRLQPASGGA